MQARIVRAEDYTTNAEITLIELIPNRTGETKLLRKIEKSGERTLKVAFDERTKMMRVVVPAHIVNAPDPPKD